MKPSVLATADRASLDWSAPPRILRFASREEAPADDRRTSLAALIWTWLIVAMIPILGGRAVALTLDEPLLGVIAGMLAIIPLMIALFPRSATGSRGARRY